MRAKTSMLVAAACALFCASTNAQVLFQENFHGNLGSAWTISGADTAFYALTAGELDLRASSQDIDTGWNNYAKNLFLIPNPATGDFSVTLKINSFVPINNNHAQIDVIAFDDVDSLIRANYGFIKDQFQTEFGTEIRANWMPEQTPLDLGKGTFYLRLTKTGVTYTQSYSTDGSTFTAINSPRRFGDGSPAFLGFCAGADPSNASHVHIASFTVESTTAPANVATVTKPAPAPVAVPFTTAPVEIPQFKFTKQSVITPRVTTATAPAVTFSSDSAVPLAIAPAVQIIWPTTLGKTYQVQQSPALATPDWTNFGDPIAGSGSDMTVFDPSGGNNQKYYRVLASP